MLLLQAIKGTQSRTFYTMPEYESWKESLGGTTRGWKIKYYKGLGTRCEWCAGVVEGVNG